MLWLELESLYTSNVVTGRGQENWGTKQ